ncbi:AEC family transporter [Paenibacillus thermotolerans]|uniref:AEC family transporter n=1 Tax=Paenibacillus thermotolerans TaxID=3027807 RepID=UPI002367F35D|nr:MULTISPECIES: AEC family transporter [unclassified Paenibacillus]
MERGPSSVVRNGFVLSNQGNCGVTVSEPVFAHNPLGTALQAIISVIQNILTYTLGVYQSLSGGERKAGANFWAMLQLPVLYAIVAAGLLRMADIRLPPVLMKPIQDVSEAFVAIALLTLGAQLAGLNIRRVRWNLVIGVLGRLVLSPLIAFALIEAFGWSGMIAQSLFIASSYPASRNSALLALEYGTDPELAAQIVLFSTVLSCLSVTAAIYAAQMLW